MSSNYKDIQYPHITYHLGILSYNFYFIWVINSYFNWSIKSCTGCDVIVFSNRCFGLVPFCEIEREIRKASCFVVGTLPFRESGTMGFIRIHYSILLVGGKCGFVPYSMYFQYSCKLNHT
jgi:hypothetical protein